MFPKKFGKAQCEPWTIVFETTIQAKSTNDSPIYSYYDSLHATFIDKKEERSDPRTRIISALKPNNISIKAILCIFVPFSCQIQSSFFVIITTLQLKLTGDN